MIKQATLTLDEYRRADDILQIESAFDNTFVFLVKGAIAHNTLNRVDHVNKEGKIINSYQYLKCTSFIMKSSH